MAAETPEVQDINKRLQKIRKTFDQTEALELQKDIRKLWTDLPEYLHVESDQFFKLSQPITPSAELKSLLAQHLKGGHGTSHFISTDELNGTLDSISNLLTKHESNGKYIVLLNKIENYMDLCELKILGKKDKNENDGDTKLMLDQIKELALLGQEISGDKSFGKEKITAINNAIKSEHKNPILSDNIKAKELETLKNLFEGKPEGYDPFSPLNAKNTYESLKNISIESIVEHIQKKAPNTEKNKYLADSIFRKKYGLDVVFSGRNFRDELAKKPPELVKIYHEERIKHAFEMGDTKRVTKGIHKMNVEGKEEKSTLKEFINNIKEICSKPLEKPSTKIEEPKNESTKLFEKFVKESLNNERPDLENMLKNPKFKFEEVKFDRINLDKNDLTKIMPFIENMKSDNLKPKIAKLSNNPVMKNYIATTDISSEKDPVYIRNIETVNDILEHSCKNGNLKSASKEEKIIYNIYSTIEGCSELNSFYRGNIDSTKGDTCVIAALLQHFYIKNPNKIETDSLRIDKSLPEEINNARMQAAKNGETISIPGIISSSKDKPDNTFIGDLFNKSFTPNFCKVATVFRGNKQLPIGNANCFGETGECIQIQETEMKPDSYIKIGDIYYCSYSPTTNQKAPRAKGDFGLSESNADSTMYDVRTLDALVLENKFGTEKINQIDKMNVIAKETLSNLESHPLNQYNYREITTTGNKNEPTLGTNGKLEVRVFNKDSYNGPRTEDFIARAESLHSTAASLNSPENTEIKAKLDANLKNLIEEIKKQAKIDPEEIKKETGVNHFSEKYSIAVNLLHDFNIENIKILHPDGNFNLVEELSRLEKTESQIVADAGRANLLHIYDVAGHTRVSISEPQGDHTNPSTLRDKPELSNFVKVSSGYIDPESSEAKIEFSAYRHSSYPPIKILGNNIEAKMERRNGATQSVKQMLDTLALDMMAKDPALSDKQPIEIKLSTMMLLTPLLKDQTFMGGDSEMRQLKDGLIALNIYNNQEFTLNGVAFKPILTQMNIPSNDAIKYQFKKLGGEFNDNVNNKGFYEYNKNFIDFIQKPENYNPVFEKILDLYKKDVVLENLEIQLKTLQEKSPTLTGLYEKLGELQENPDKAILYQDTLKQIRSKEKELNGLYKEIIDRQKETWESQSGEIKEIKTSIRDMLLKNPDNNSLQVAQLYLDSAEIYYNKAHKMAEHGHQFQTRYLLTNEKMGNTVEFFCKSGEDRTGRANNHLEEFLAFRRENNVFPEFNNKSDLKKLEIIAHDVHNGSVSKEITNQNAPGARGLQQGSSFGSNAALQLGEFDKTMGATAKGVYGSMMQKLKYKIQAKLPNIGLNKEFEAMSKQLQAFLNDKLSLNSDAPKPIIENKSTENSTLESQKNISEISKKLDEFKNKANEIFTQLETSTKNLNDTFHPVNEQAKQLSHLYSQIRALESETSDQNQKKEIKQVEADIGTKLNALTKNVAQHINQETNRSIDNTASSTISGAPSRPLKNNPGQIQQDIIDTIKPIFDKSDQFTIKPIDRSESVLVMKDGDKFASVNSKEIQAHSSNNSANDYKVLIQAALKNYEKPLLIYMPESEKPKLDKAIAELKSEPSSNLKDKDFECTSSRAEYDTKQKAKEVASAAKLAPNADNRPKPVKDIPTNPASH